MVRRIFAMTLAGYGPYQIATQLTQDKIEIPSVHLARFNEGVNRTKQVKDIYGWGSSTIVHILKKREYLGHTVNFKTRKHFKDKKSHYVDESEWTIFLVWTKKMQILITLQHNVFCRICLSKLSLQVSSTNAQIAHSGDRKLGISPDETGL